MGEIRDMGANSQGSEAEGVKERFRAVDEERAAASGGDRPRHLIEHAYAGGIIHGKHSRSARRQYRWTALASSGTELCFHTGGVVGSIPATPASLRSLRELRLGRPSTDHEKRSERRRRSPKGEDGQN